MKPSASILLGLLGCACLAGTTASAQNVPAVFASSYGLDPLASGLPEADPDLDGVANLLEYLHGGDPTKPSASVLPTVSTLAGEGGSSLVLRYRRHLAASPLVTQVVEHTGGLSQPWVPAVQGQGGVTWESTLLDVATEQVTVTIPVAEGARFVRLRASLAVLPAAPAGLALVPAGGFAMGDNLDRDGSAPLRTVHLSAYYIGKTEVTFEQWDEVRSWAFGQGYTDLSSGSYKDINHPIHTVSWNDIVKWCNAASEKAGLTPCYRTAGGEVYRTGFENPVFDRLANGIRLPTEAEWEKAARGGLTGRRFGWGDTITHSQANYNSSTSYAYDISPTRGNHPLYDTGGSGTSPVGSFPANGFGLFDMSGNLWELCHDWNANYPAGVLTDPTGPSTGTARIMRGGRAGFNASGCRVAGRNNFGPGVPVNSIGFRIARTVTP